MTQRKKILFLTRYSRMGASSRLRTYQYQPLFEANGCSVAIKPLFNDRYLSALYAGRGVSFINVSFCYARRLFLLFTLYRYDKIVIEKELFPFLPAWGEWWVSRLGKGYIVDYDDAVFHNYDRHTSFWIRLLLKNKISKVMRNSQKVLAGNAYLAESARKTGAARVILLPTVVDCNRYRAAESSKTNTLVKVGWIGSPSTLKYLKSLLPVLESVKQRIPFELVVIGGGSRPGFSGKETMVQWSEETEVREIQQLDIGIMPLRDSSWEKGKCGYKLIQYMACGLPVLASPVGVNTELVRPRCNGFLPKNRIEWEDYLVRLIADRELRVKMGSKGYKFVMEKYTLKSSFPVYYKALE